MCTKKTFWRNAGQFSIKLLLLQRHVSLCSSRSTRSPFLYFLLVFFWGFKGKLAEVASWFRHNLKGAD